jgi:hypothetical protein
MLTRRYVDRNPRPTIDGTKRSVAELMMSRSRDSFLSHTTRPFADMAESDLVPSLAL